MKNRFLLILGSIILIINGLFFLSGCKTTTPFYGFEVYVTLSEGVSGTPESGTYQYSEGDIVSYNYSVDSNHVNLRVTLDNQEIEASGTFAVTGDHTLTAYADPVYNIIGTWNITEEYADGSSFSVTLVFSGTSNSGTVTDSHGGVGTYTVDEYNNISFTLQFTEVTYNYQGDFEGATSMKGNSQKVTSAETYNGIWIASRTDQASSKFSPSCSASLKGKEFPEN